MTYPAGVQTSKLTFSNPKTHGGKDADRTEITVQPTASIVWAETGEPLDDFAETVAPSAGSPGVFTAPFVDQPGVRDQAGNAFTMWAYIVTRRSWLDGVEGRPVRKSWQPLLGQAEVDFDTLPGGSIGLPVAVPIPPVTSVAGLANAVSAAELAGALVPHLPNDVTPESVAAALPTRLSDASLKSTYAGLGIFENFDAANFRLFRAGLARSRSGENPARISFYGDSNSAGYQAPNSNDYTRGYAARAASILDGKLGPTKTGLIFTRIGGANAKLEPRFTLGSGWSSFPSNTQGMAGAGGIQGTSGGTAGTLDITLSGVNAFTVWYPIFGGGSSALALSIDAEAATVVSAQNATASMGKTTITTSTVGTHTLKIKSNAGGAVYIHAIEGFDNTLIGVTRVTASGYNGGTAANWNAAPAPADPWDPSRVVFNQNIDAPHLTLINLSINAHNAGTPIATYKSDMSKFIAKARSSSDVILVASAAGGVADQGVTWDAYLDAQRELAATHGCGLINMQKRWGPYASASITPLWYWGDPDHPSTPGYWDLGQAAADAILLAAGRAA